MILLYFDTSCFLKAVNVFLTVETINNITAPFSESVIPNEYCSRQEITFFSFSEGTNKRIGKCGDCAWFDGVIHTKNKGPLIMTEFWKRCIYLSQCACFAFLGLVQLSGLYLQRAWAMCNSALSKILLVVLGFTFV